MNETTCQILVNIQRLEANPGATSGKLSASGADFYVGAEMEKPCMVCGEVKQMEEFHRNPKHKDGRLNKCKKCNLLYIKTRFEKKKLIPGWWSSFLEKQRPSYIKYNRTKRSKIRREELEYEHKIRYPEKKKAGQYARHHIHVSDKMFRHHWSYKKEHFTDVVIVDSESHYKIHRYTIYDKENFQYKTLDGVLLNTKRAALAYYKTLKDKE